LENKKIKRIGKLGDNERSCKKILREIKKVDHKEMKNAKRKFGRFWKPQR